MRKPAILITGAGGEIGHGLLTRLTRQGRQPIVTLDLNPLEPALAGLAQRELTGSILDTALLERILAEYQVDTVFHLAALLSTRSEYTPVTAHQVNVDGTLRLLEFAERQGESHGRPVLFVYPSSIAAYGLPDLDTKLRAGSVREDDFATPCTMYGCNKLYCELLGQYYARHYKQLAAGRAGNVDFRAVRFPGLISAATMPAGGTSDYAPEMIHAAARGERYACFVRPDTRIPFMAMPDGVDALITLAACSPRRPDSHGLQRPRVQSLGRGDSGARPAGVSGRRDLLRGRCQTSANPRFVASRHRRYRGASRLGLSADPRPARRVRPLSDSGHHGQVSTRHHAREAHMSASPSRLRDRQEIPDTYRWSLDDIFPAWDDWQSGAR